jgi:hypothetical protein
MPIRSGALLIGLVAGCGLLSGCGESAKPPAQPISGEEFRRVLVGIPLCSVPKIGPFAGKSICTVHLADGSAVVAGSGVLARGLWDLSGSQVCRRDAAEPPERKRCVEYARIDAQRFRNSDGVEFCVGPCS